MAGGKGIPTHGSSRESIVQDRSGSGRWRLFPTGARRGIILLILALLWGTLAFLLIAGRIAVRPDEIGSYNSYWSLSILAALVILINAHILLQQIARHLEYVSFLKNIVLLVSSATVLTSLGVAITQGEQFASWVIPVTVLGVLTLIVLLLGQAVAVKSVRERYYRELERIIWSRAATVVTAVQTRALVNATKHIMPVDFHPNDLNAVIAKYPEAWQDLAELLRQHGVDWKEEDFNFVRGLAIPGARGTEQLYYYFGWIGTWIGSLTILLGTIALGGHSA